MRFEWDPAKDEINRAKHGLAFEEASGLFTSGADYLEIYDEEHSEKKTASLRLARSNAA